MCQFVSVFIVWIFGVIFYLVLFDCVFMGQCVQFLLEIDIFDWFFVGGFLVVFFLVMDLFGDVIVQIDIVCDQNDGVIWFFQCF